MERPAGDDVRSGVVNAGMPVDIVATAVAAESTYAGLVRLVEQAQAASAPFVRLADRLAVFFVPLTLLLAGAAWALSGDPVRAVAVLVVATPCPLLLAAPIAFISGLSRAARVGVVIKGGGALERLAAGRVMLFDKTGTLTHGAAGVGRRRHCRRADRCRRAARLAASLDQVSPHVLASCDRQRRRAPRTDPGDAPGGRGGARLRSSGQGRLARGRAGQGIVDRARRSPAVGAPGAPARGSGRFPDRLRRGGR